MRTVVKQLAARLPPVKSLIESRDTLLDERNDIMAHRDRLLDELTQLRETLKRGEALESENRQLRAENHAAFDKLQRFGEGPPPVPNGHFYSAIPSIIELKRNREAIFTEWPRTLADIDLREDEQLNLLREIASGYSELPFNSLESKDFRYYYENPAYSYSDAIFLNGMIRHAKPSRVVEVGSGFSSCMLLDTNERWFDNKIDCTFVEPYPELLRTLFKDGDAERVKVIATRVQDVPLSVFSSLERNDILFVDSTHVSKIGSDVNHIFSSILPSLASGVLIHFHDIFYPFEYPEEWAMEGRAWNEAYMLRVFLQNNRAFEIVMFNTFLEHFHRDFFEKQMPLCLKNTGASIWLRKV